MNSYPRMTLRQFCDAARENDIYIQSMEDEAAAEKYVYLSYTLRGCSGIMSMEVVSIHTTGEESGSADLVAVLDIPAAWLEKEV